VNIKTSVKYAKKEEKALLNWLVKYKGYILDLREALRK